jgi:sterol desaturase/sphingolipid hydroxylase (fatty acid hydroxylase superfamily)
MLCVVHPVVGVALPQRDSRVEGPLVAGLVVLHGIELLVLLQAAGVTARLARAHPGHGAGLPALLVLAALLMVGWQACRLLRGRRSLNVSGLAVQSGILMASIAVAVQNLAAGLTGIVLACAVLAGWGRLGKAGRAGATFETPVATENDAPPQTIDSRRASQIRLGGVVLAVLTALVVLAALSMRSQIIFGLAILAVIFIPLERLFALHPHRVLRRGWRTDVVHFLVNGAALRIGMLVSVVVIGGFLRAFVPAPLRDAVAASPGWAQIAAGLTIATMGGYAGHRAAHEVPLLWRFHRVHHSSRELDWLAATHLHPLDETFTRSVAVLPLYALGFGRVSLGAFLILITLQAIFIHANVRLRFGPLRWVIGTPQFHHWHHAREPQAYNSNYAGEFPLLDALFGTLYFPANRWPAQYGVDDTQPDGYLRQIAWPFRRRGAAQSELDRLMTSGPGTAA